MPMDFHFPYDNFPPAAHDTVRSGHRTAMHGRAYGSDSGNDYLTNNYDPIQDRLRDGGGGGLFIRLPVTNVMLHATFCLHPRPGCLGRAGPTPGILAALYAIDIRFGVT